MQFVEQLILIAVGVGLGGVALWTWQRRYWEYQLERQREDWEQRQTYSRKDSQRQSMERLLVEINHETESFLAATHMAVSALKRSHDASSSDSTTRPSAWGHGESVKHAVASFNEADQLWASKSRELAGQVNLYFGRNDPRVGELWQRIFQTSGRVCEDLNEYIREQTQSRRIWDTMHGIRSAKDELLLTLQGAIDAFVTERLERTGDAAVHRES